MDTHFFAGLTKFKLDAGKFRRDDDFSDRFSHTFTTLLLVIFTLVISARQYIGKPIACWVPTEFTRAQEEYAESVCWVTSTYFVRMSSINVPSNVTQREELKLHYYQWVPFILMIQAFMFNLPCIIWRLFNWQSGIHLSSIMEVSCEIEMIKDPETRRSNIIYVARHIEDALASQREYRTGCSIKCRQCLARLCCVWFGKRYGNYLICLYLIVKSLYIFNTVGQFFLMSRILGTNYTFYGLDILRDIADGFVWEESGNFPRITFCDFVIRKLANSHRHTVQCVLPINMFNEKIFIFLWFWFILVAAVNSSSFIYWSYKSSFRFNRVHFIRKFLKLRNALETGDKKRTSTFVDTFLRQDGVFIIRLAAQNAGELVASELVERLWLMYKSSLNLSSTRPKSGESLTSPKPASQGRRHRHTRPSSTSSGGTSNLGYEMHQRVSVDKEAKLPPPPSYMHYPGPKPPPITTASDASSSTTTTSSDIKMTALPPLPPTSRTMTDLPPPLPPPPSGSSAAAAARLLVSPGNSSFSTSPDSSSISSSGPTKMLPRTVHDTLKRSYQVTPSTSKVEPLGIQTDKQSGGVKSVERSDGQLDEDPGEFV